MSPREPADHLEASSNGSADSRGEERPQVTKNLLPAVVLTYLTGADPGQQLDQNSKESQ